MSTDGIQPADIHFASLAAHQLQSPVATAVTILRTVISGAAGPLNPQQQRLLTRALERCEQAVEASRRMLAIARAGRQGPLTGVVNLAALVRRAQQRYAEESGRRGIGLEVEVSDAVPWVRGLEDTLAEVLDALLHNAFKYTPDQGRIRVQARVDAERRSAELVVSDSGVGIPEGERERVFEPFVRGSAAAGSARPGTGLGLAFVRAVVTAAGGKVWAEAGELGGARIVARWPAAHVGEEQQEDQGMNRPMKVVIIGGVAAGPKTAARIIRLRPDTEVTIVEKGRFLSYAGCGLPYYISGVVQDHKELMSTALGAVRDPVFFQQVKNVRVMNQTEAIAIDRRVRSVTVRDGVSGRESSLLYDKLVLATGASPVVPDIPGVGLENVYTLHGVNDAEGIRAALAAGKARDVVIVGGGLIGVEITEALASKGSRVTIVEAQPQILRMLDWEVAALVEQHLEAHGVKVMTGTPVLGLKGGPDGKVRGVVTDGGTLPADMVVLAIGVRPNVALARQAGLEIGTTGAIRVDDHLRTSDPDIYAAGDCVECVDLLTGRPCYVPLGSTANKQGRVVADNICGRDERFPGVLGSTVCKVFDFCVARTGLTESAARAGGRDVVTALAPAPDKAHYMPSARPICLKLVVDRPTRRVLGAQAVGPGAGDKRIDVVAMALTAGMTVDALANADLCYAPPYAEAMDNVITAANVARNKLDGLMDGITAMEVRRMQEAGEEFVFLDVRTPAEAEQVRLPGSTLIPLGALRGRLGDLPRDRPIVTFCRISLRGYEAALVLRAAGFQNVRVLDGGIDMWPYEKL